MSSNTAAMIAFGMYNRINPTFGLNANKNVMNAKGIAIKRLVTPFDKERAMPLELAFIPTDPNKPANNVPKPSIKLAFANRVKSGPFQ